jgi:iron complex outermembrane receptor protein
MSILYNSCNLRRDVLIFLLTSLSGTAMAQATVVPDAEQVHQNSNNAIQDIVVTAQRRSERLQDIPIAVTAITGDALGEKHAMTTQDLQLSIPSLNYGNQSGFATPYLRGIGSDIAAINSDPSIATYIDGVYLANNTSTVVSLLGVERIEVLLGPQGTLYGKNALGGAINVVTRTPTSETDGQIQITGGNYNRLEGNGYVSGRIANNLYGGIYAVGQRRDFYYDYQIPVNQRQLSGTPSHEWAWGVRGKLVWDVGALKVVASLEHSELAQADGNVFRNLQDPVTLQPNYNPQDKYVDSADARSSARPRSTLAVVRADLDMDFARFVSISSYRKVKFQGGTDIDGGPVPIFSVFAESHSDDYSQEFQLQSPTGNPITWTVGLYGFYEDASFDPTGLAIFGTPVLTFANVKTTSWAVFGQATFPIVDDLNLTVGARYSRDRKEFSAFDFTQAIVNRQLSGPTTLLVQYPDDRNSWGAFTPKVTLDYKMGSTLLYATYSKGYKPGAYNAAGPANPGPINPEKLTSIEAGTKSDFLDGKLRVNTSFYHYKFKDIQVQSLAPGGGGATLLQNGASATAYGAEITSIAQITPAFSLNANLAFEHAEFDSFPAFAANLIGVPAPPFAVNSPISLDASGNKLARAPKFVFSGGAHYVFDLGNSDRVKLDADWYHNSGFFWDPSNQTKQKAFDLVNLSATYVNDAGDWSIQTWVKNVFNEYHFNTITTTSLAVSANEAEPRMYGVTVTKNF